MLLDVEVQLMSLGCSSTSLITLFLLSDKNRYYKNTARAAHVLPLAVISTSSNKCGSLSNRIPMIVAVITVTVTHYQHA